MKLNMNKIIKSILFGGIITPLVFILTVLVVYLIDLLIKTLGGIGLLIIFLLILWAMISGIYYDYNKNKKDDWS